MKNLLSGFLIVISLCKFSDTTAQNPFRIQHFSNPLNLNPAFTGLSQNPRIGSQYVYSNKSDFVSANINYDQQLDFLKGGVGVSTNYMSSNNGGLRSYSVSGLYAYDFKINENAGIRAGINGSFNNYTWDRIKFYGDINTSLAASSIINKQYFNLDAGIMAYHSNVYGGISVQNLPQPTVEFSENFKILNTRIYSFHAGGFIHLSEDVKNGWMLNPYVMSSSVTPPETNSPVKRDWRHIYAPGLNISKSFFTLGTRYLFDQIFYAWDVTAGINVGKIKLGYSTRLMTRNKFNAQQHEVSFIYHFNKPKDVSSSKMISNLRRIF